MSGRYLYCQSPECGEYLGSLGGDSCHLCGWCSGEHTSDEAESFCEYCGGNDEDPPDHCMDCTRPIDGVRGTPEASAQLVTKE